MYSSEPRLWKRFGLVGLSLGFLALLGTAALLWMAGAEPREGPPAPETYAELEPALEAFLNAAEPGPAPGRSRYGEVADSGGLLRPLWVWRFEPASPQSRPRRLLVTAGLHGDEPAPVLALLGWLERTAGAPPQGPLELHVIPAASPRSLARRHRYSPEGLDPNRDWSRQELPETRALAAYIRSQGPFDLVLDLHESSRPGYFLYNYGSDQDPVPALWRRFLGTAGLPADRGPAEWGFAPREGVLTQPPWLMAWRRLAGNLHFDGWVLQEALTGPAARVYTYESPKGRPLPERIRSARRWLDLWLRHAAQTGTP